MVCKRECKVLSFNIEFTSKFTNLLLAVLSDRQNCVMFCNTTGEEQWLKQKPHCTYANNEDTKAPTYGDIQF